MSTQWDVGVGSKQGKTRRRPIAATPPTHAAGTGPDSVYFHAVRPGRLPASGPVAVCGYPLRTRAEDIHADERTFEDRWSDREDCCGECGSSLGLSEHPVPEIVEPKSKRNWVMIGSVATLVPMLMALLGRVAVVAFR